MSNTVSMPESLRNELCGLRKAIIEMLERFRQMHSPIRESREKMPLASSQLKHITEETEAAATRVLDMTEAIVNRDAELLAALTELRNSCKGANAEWLNKIDACRSLAEQNQNDTYTIMETLQFQDITAQQMSHTMDLLLDVDSRLDVILGVMDGKREEAHRKAASTDRRAYDPYARYAPGQAGQKDVDSVVNTFHTPD